MDSKIYKALTKRDASWISYQCGLPNFSTSFESLDAGTFNTFESLSDLSLSSVSSDIRDPITASSPKSTKPPSCNRKPESTFMKLLTINFQSIKAKRETFWNLLESSKPDIILGCETGLKPTVTNQEIIPPGYEVYRQDRHDGYGGVLVIVKSCYISSIVDVNIHSELIAVHIEGVDDNSSLVVASFYRQPNRGIDHTHSLCQDLKEVMKKYKKSTI
jgi:hypothetical protein